MARAPKSPRIIDALKHDAATRTNIPTAEMESFFRREEDTAPRPPKHYPRARPLADGERRTAEEPGKPELIWNGAQISITDAQMAELAETGRLTLSDAQLVWRGKDRQDWSDLVVNVPPLFIQEKIHPKAIIDDLKRHTAEKREAQAAAPDLFADFNGLPEGWIEEGFYQHEGHWSNRMILGDSLQVMASLAERESLRGKVQCIYFDPPYGIKFNSNWQVSTQSRDVKDGKQTDISREPEQVKAFRDTWKDGIHSYLTYLRDRLTAMRDLLTESGSIFVQIGDENVHRVRAVMDEVFGAESLIAQIAFRKTSGTGAEYLDSTYDFALWYAKDASRTKFRRLYLGKKDHLLDTQYTSVDPLRADVSAASARFMPGDLSSQGASEAGTYPFNLNGVDYFLPPNTHWKASRAGMPRLAKAGRLTGIGRRIRYKRFSDDWPVVTFSNSWDDTVISGYAEAKTYTVQTSTKVVERCILMATDPGDLVLDPTCGSGTTAYVAEQWGRRWITVDTSRVALALARTRLMAARYPWYMLADSREGRAREAALTQRPPAETPVHNDIRQGFVYERVPHITLKSIANNPLIDDIWEKWQAVLEPLRTDLNLGLGTSFEEWEVPRDLSAWLETKEGADASAHAIERSRVNDITLRENKQSARYHHKRFWHERRQLESIQYNWVVSERDPSDRVPLEVINRDWISRKLKPACKAINDALGSEFDWQSVPDDLTQWLQTDGRDALLRLHARWWEARIARQREIDVSIAARADVEFLYDKPYTDPSRVRVAGPFTVESLSPHRALPASEEELIDEIEAAEGKRSAADADLAGQDFAAIVIDYLKAEGVKQQAKGDRITFESIAPWPGNFIGASATFIEGGPLGDSGGPERRAAILIGPEYGTVGRQDIVAAAREAADARFDVLIACAFNFDAHSSELGSLGSLKILKARINPDMHMSAELKNTGRGNMFVVFGEPDVRILDDGGPEIGVEVRGVDVFDPNTGDIRSSDTDGIAAWFIDTAYNEESFFVRHAYFLGANDPYKSLKTALQAEIDEDAWATLYSDTSRPFARPRTGRIAVKVINHFGDEVMKVFGV